MNNDKINSIIAFFWERSLKIFFYSYDLSEKKGDIVGESSKSLSENWDKMEELFDEALSDIENSSGITANSLVYVLSSSYIDENDGLIKKTYVDIFKSVSKKLGLKPLGYISIKEVLQRIIKDDSEYISSQSLVVEVDATSISLYTPVKEDIKFLGRTFRTDSIKDDIVSILSTIGITTLVSSIYICSEDENNSYIESIFSAKWPTQIFVQIPKVIEINPDKLYEGMNNLIATNLEHSLDKPKIIKPIVTKTGFMINQDVSLYKDNKDLFSNKKRFTLKAPPFLNVFKKMNLNFRTPKIAVLISIISIFVFIFSIFLLLFFIHKATFVIKYKAKDIKTSVTLYVSTASKDKNNVKIIEGDKIVKVSGSLKTTGTQDRGEKAKGTITIYNWENQPINFTKGEKVILTNSNLVYELDSDTQVPSAKEVALGTKETGKSKVGVTASKIGSEYNVEKDLKGSIGGKSLDIVFVTTDTRFTGGTKKTIATISKDDLIRMDIQATESALIEFKKQEKDKGKNNLFYIYDAFKTDIISSTPSGEVGLEASDLSYKAEVKIIYSALSINDLKSSLVQSLGVKLNSSEIIDDKTIAYTIKEFNPSKQSINVSVEAKTKLSYDSKKIKDLVIGKDYLKSKNEIIKLLPVKEVDVSIDPSFIPVLSKRVPFFIKNINIVE